VVILTAQGEWLDGSHNYSLHLDAGIPAKNFWSLMVYDTEIRSMILNGKEKNWIPTNPKESWLCWCRMKRRAAIVP